MPINFLDNACKTSSNSLQFGLCDKPHPTQDPAFINEDDASEWIATVNNPRQVQADFHAVDHCVTVKRANGDDESRCDGILLHETNLTFVELKDRAGKGWFGAGVKQLTATHTTFSANHDITAYTQIEAYIANKQKPLVNVSYKNDLQKFKTATGITLKAQATIDI